MGRKKQTTQEILDKAMENEPKFSQVEEPIEVKAENVSPFHFEFNNEGLNQLRDKINEIVKFLNK